MTAASLNRFDLPWAQDSRESKVFRRYLYIALALFTVFGVIVPLIQLPEKTREEVEELPPALAQIILEKPKPIVIPPPPKVEPPKVVPEEKPRPLPKTAEVAPTPQPKVADVKENVKVAGLLQFKDAFADMRETVDMTKLKDTGALQQGAGDAPTIDRSLLTSKRGTRSAGVNVAGLSRDTGGVALAGRETTKVEASPGAVGAGGVRLGRNPNGNGLAGNNNSDLDQRSRSIEDIRRVFDANKGSIFAIYNRALRSDPTLAGKVVLELVIDPAGQVVDCRVIDSELADAGLVDRIVSRVRMFNFGSKDVRTTTISYPVHFLPT